MSRTYILKNDDIVNITKRMAFQIYETFGADDKIIIAGIEDNGYFLAERIYKQLCDIIRGDIKLCKVCIDKKIPQNTITTSLEADEYANSNILLIDDVLNTGTTLIYGVRHFLAVPLKKLKTAVLVDRNHKKYPIKVDFKGISLSTSTKEHVQVVFDQDNCFAILE